jgi:hypothetical protein
VTGPDPAAALGRDTAAHWDGLYRAGGEIWGGTPSELVAVAVERLRTLGPAAANLTLLDLGCGYGRDAVALRHALGLAIVGVDGAGGGGGGRGGAPAPPRGRPPPSRPEHASSTVARILPTQPAPGPVAPASTRCTARTSTSFSGRRNAPPCA